MNGTPERPLRLTRDIALPLGVIISLATFSFGFGRWTSKQDAVIESVATAIGKHAAELKSLTEQLTSRGTQIDRIDYRVGEMKKEFDLLKDYTRGRIERLPYHAPGGIP
jgi:hypothetical protein